MPQTTLHSFFALCIRDRPARYPVQPRLSRPHRLVQSVMTQWFPSGPMYRQGINDKVEAAELQWLAPARYHPDLPRGDTSPLPYAHPKNEEESRGNVRAVAYRAASAAGAFFEFNHDRNLGASGHLHCVLFLTYFVGPSRRKRGAGRGNGIFLFRSRPHGYVWPTQLMTARD